MEKNSQNFKEIAKYDRSNHQLYFRSFRTRICDDYALNKCPFDKKSCFQTHGKTPSRRVRPDSNHNFGVFYHEIGCQNIIKKRPCPLKDNCRYAHTREEIEYHPQKFKSKPCDFHVDNLSGFCSKWGIHCPFAHGQKDLNLSTRPKAAKNYKPQSNPPNNTKETVSEQFLKRFKTKPCPKGIMDCADIVLCEFYHTENDRRRNPFSKAYNCERCRFSSFGGNGSKCPEKDGCNFAHTTNEILYHPKIYKLILCRKFSRDNAASCVLGKLCSQAHGESDLRFARDGNSHIAAAEQLRSTFAKMAPLPLGGCTERASDVDSLDFSLVDFDSTGIPPAAEGEGPEIGELREEYSRLLEECERLSLEYKNYYFGMVDAVMDRIDKERKALMDVKDGEIAYLENLAFMKMEEREALNARMKCPLCLCNERNVALDPCGHVFCASCVRATPSKTCPFCKKKYKNAQNLKIDF